MKKQAKEWRRWQASVSLLLAIILPSVIFLSQAAFHYAIQRRYEADAARAVTAAAELCLSQFSRKLWKDYGLWAFQEEEVKIDSAQKLSADPDFNLSLESSEELFGSGSLKKQILRYMRVRAPLYTADDILTRIRSAASERQLLSGGQSTALAVRNANQELEAYAAYQEGAPAVKRLTSGTLSNEQEVNLEESDSSEESDLASELMGAFDALPPFLKDAIRNFAKKSLPVYHSLGTAGVNEENAFAPEMIESLAARIDILLDSGLSVSADHLSLAQYTLAYFPAAVHQENGRHEIRKIATPDGRLHEEIAKERALQAEIIASGKAEGEEARKHCELLITGLRFIPQYIAASKDVKLQENYLQWAGALSSVIGFLSAGTTVIPPESLRHFIQAAHCFYLAHKDFELLKKGDGLPFWPQSSKAYLSERPQYFRFYYGDYLLLILLTRSQDDLAASIESLIQKDVEGSWYCACKVEGKSNHYQITREARYLDD